MPQQTDWCISLLVSGTRTTEEEFENPHEDAPCPYSASGLGASLPSPCIPPGGALKSVSVCAGGSSTLTEENRFLCCMLLSETCGFHRRNHAEVSPDKKKFPVGRCNYTASPGRCLTYTWDSNIAISPAPLETPFLPPLGTALALHTSNRWPSCAS